MLFFWSTLFKRREDWWVVVIFIDALLCSALLCSALLNDMI